ncbi:UBP43 hydrolase, partial [Scopus umbretta]|nr:UBP43 hydrolase [Scopus umbretta]
RQRGPRLSALPAHLLQNIVSKHSSQFRGNAQHDALEFLLWLLDRMHEDLGATSPALQTHIPEEVGGPAGVSAHTGSGSSLTCPHCLKQSNTFDPFLCISLPIPLRQTRALNVTLVLQCERWRFVRVGLAVPLHGTVAELREMVAREGRIPPEQVTGWGVEGGRAPSGTLRAPGAVPQVILAEVSPRGFLRSLGDAEELGAAGEGAPLYAFQPPPARRAGTAPLLSRLAGGWPPAQPRLVGSGLCGAGGGGMAVQGVSGSFLGIGGRRRASPAVPRFGPPLVLREERGISWEQLQQSILAQLRALLRGEVQAQGAGALFRIRLAGCSAPCAYLSPQDPRPLCHPAVDRALQLSGAGGPPHVKLTVEWDMSTKERLFGNIQEEVVQDAESVRLQQQVHRQQHSCTLDECFQLYTKEEQVWGTLP